MRCKNCEVIIKFPDKKTRNSQKCGICRGVNTCKRGSTSRYESKITGTVVF